MSISQMIAASEASNAPPAEARGPFIYCKHLNQRLAAAVPAQPKTVRTRLRLMLSVARLLELGGLHELRVADCAAEAGLAHGTFYRYWPDGSTAAQEVLSDFMATVRQRRPGSPAAAPIYDRIRAANRYYVYV